MRQVVVPKPAVRVAIARWQTSGTEVRNPDPKLDKQTLPNPEQHQPGSSELSVLTVETD
jgi:hypothetical protein